MPNSGGQRVCDGPAMDRLVATMAQQLTATPSSSSPIGLVGIRTRGVPLAERLARELSRILGVSVEVGAVDITLYRDDLGQTQSWPVLHGTEIPFNVDGANVVLVDDVLFTGRTIRAALNAICDLGRPASVRLAVLVDRGHREIPIQADVVGLELSTAHEDHVRVRLKPVDPVDEVVWTGAGTVPLAAEGRSPS